MPGARRAPHTACMDTMQTEHAEPARSRAGKWAIAGLCSSAMTLVALLLSAATYDPHDLVGGDAYLLTMMGALLAGAVAVVCWLVAGLCALVGAVRNLRQS